MLACTKYVIFQNYLSAILDIYDIFGRIYLMFKIRKCTRVIIILFAKHFKILMIYWFCVLIENEILEYTKKMARFPCIGRSLYSPYKSLDNPYYTVD